MTANGLQTYLESKNFEWQHSIKHARTIIPEKNLKDSALIKLSENSENCEQLNAITKLLYQDLKERPIGINGIDQLLTVVDKSNFSLREWINALYEFDKYLTKNQRRAPFLKMLGFLQCCEESPDNKNAKVKLDKLLESMLEQFGFIG